MRKAFHQYVSTKLNQIKIRDKLILMFLSGVVIPIAVVGLFLTNELKANAIKDAQEQADMNVERVKQRINEVLKGPIMVANHLQFDERLSELVNTDYDHSFSVFQAYRSYPDFAYHKGNHPEIETIRLYVDNPTLLNNWTFIPVEGSQMASWYNIAKADVGFYQWFYLQDETQGGGYYLSLMKRINFIEYGTFGLLIITIAPDLLETIMQQETHQTVVVDEQNSIISSSEPSFIGENLDELVVVTDQGKGKHGFYEGQANGEPIHIMETSLFPELSQNQLRIVSIIHTDDIVGAAKKLSYFGILVTGLGIAFSLFLIVWFSWGYVNRLSRLSATMKEVAQGNLTTKVALDGTDEIGQISLQLNKMIDDLNKSIAQVLEANEQKTALERKQNEMKFKMMASQMNPHFLFNTLEAIRMRAHMSNETDIAKAVKRLGQLLRKSLEVGSSMIPLKEELEMVRSYLEIQSFRYGERLTYDMDDAVTIDNVAVIPLTIQPLVENAVSHGLEAKEADGYVNICIKQAEDGTWIEVSDNGIGMGPKRQQEVQAMIEDPLEKPENRIGLRNVHQRLKQTYGTDGLLISSSQGEGTTVRFLIPKEEGSHV
ncbi:sensor histidine kinase [Shouchella clausii]|uniref:sensor histidine kinase n=1 Tax=Shouchella clausii TaxID=79880 RepID=UPI000BA721F9|nr:sensor histidine kinase [Shouchella clausii]PAD91010.1 hypothetical protein CHH52_17010 [Shouchella clausii]